MGISINWAQKEIFVPKEVTTIVQLQPTEIRQLDLNSFRLELKSLEDSYEGMPYQRTHKHNSEVLLGGIVYARTIEIINGYTVTFEDGQYAVNLVGANSNVGDVINLNQVSVRSSNAAGLISNQAIEYSSFNGGVTVDKINGRSGTVFPIGTPLMPVNNIPDARLIAERRGFSTLFVKGDYTFGDGDDVSNFDVVGESSNKTSLVFLDAAYAPDVHVKEAKVTGIFDTLANFTNCLIIDTKFVQGNISNCVLEGTITLDGGSLTTILDCKDGIVDRNNAPCIDFNGTGNSLAVRNYSGDLVLKNKSGPESIEINMATGGHLRIEDTVSNGKIKLTGIMEITNLATGTSSVDISQVIYPEQTQLAAFGNKVFLDVNGSNSGTKFPMGTKQNYVNNLTDAMEIARFRNLDTIEFRGTLIVGTEDISGFSFVGESKITSAVYLSGYQTNEKCTFKNLVLTGTVNGSIIAEDCGIQNLHQIGIDEFASIFNYCLIVDDDNEGVISPAIHLRNTGGDGNHIHFINCMSSNPEGINTTLDLNGSNHSVNFKNYSGDLIIQNSTADVIHTFNIAQGLIRLADTNTNGTMIFAGLGDLIDHENNEVKGDINGIAIYNRLMQNGLLPEQNDKLMSLDTDAVLQQATIAANNTQK